MAPSSGIHHSALASEFERPFPPLGRSSTAPVAQRSRADPAYLAPEDAFYAASPPRRLSSFENGGNGSGNESRPRHNHHNRESRSRSRRRKRNWKKLLWVKQSCMTFP